MLSEENIQLSGLREEVVKLHDENQMLRKDLEEECRLSKCENKRKDFDMEMELALEKQKQKGLYLQNSLEPLVETLKAGLSALQECMPVMEQQQQEVAYATDYCMQAANT